MDINHDVRMLREYYANLETVSATPLPAEMLAEIEDDLLDSETDKDYATAMSFWLHVLVPFINIYSYIINNRILHLELPSHLADVNPYEPCLPPETIFQKLATLNPLMAHELIGTIRCSSQVQSLLTEAFSAHDQKQFCSIIRNHDCHLQAISHLCNQLWEDYRPSLNYSDEQADLTLEVIATSCMASSDTNPDLVESITQMSQSLHQLCKDNSDDNFNQYIADFDSYNLTLFQELLIRYFDNIDYFKPREIELIEDILNHAEARDIVHHILKQQTSASQEPDPSEPLPQLSKEPQPLRTPIGFKANWFSVPTDFMTQRCTSEFHDEYFDCHEAVLKAGPNALQDLINYLGKNDYIPDTAEAKRLMAYRLTDKGRPENVYPIEWHGHNNNPYELIYLVKHLNVRGDFVKMRRLFTGPNWVKNRDSSYAKSAAYEFRQFLHSLYPTICPL